MIKLKMVISESIDLNFQQKKGDSALLIVIYTSVELDRS